MKKKLIDLLYGTLLLIGLLAGIYGIGYEITWLKWVAVYLLICLPIAVDGVQRILRRED